MESIITAIIIIAIVAAASLYIYKAKKSGQKCIGCPDSRTCSGSCHSCSGCGSADSEA